MTPVIVLGDVYLGAPVAASIRHRLVTTKYNPADLVPENAVIGGA